LGIEIPQDSFPGMEYRIRTFIWFWLVSVGAINLPTYKQLEATDDSEAFRKTDEILIGVIWLVWLAN